MGLMVDVPVLPAAVWIQKIAASDQVYVPVAEQHVKAVAVTVKLTILALLG